MTNSLVSKGDDRPEAQLMRALADSPAPQRLHVIGASGAGKTSLIRKVLGDLVRRTSSERRHEILVIDVGDDPARLSSPAIFMRTVVQMIERQGHRFGNIDPEVMTELAAEATTRTGRQVEHRVALGAMGFGYTAALKEAFSAVKLGENPARARDDFEDIVRLVAHECRPVIVIDDTEHFVTQRSGEIQAESVHNLFHSAIRTLAEVEALDVVVATHPLYRGVDAVKEVSDRFGFREVAVAELPPDRADSALGLILQRRLDRKGIVRRVDDVIDPVALAQLEGVYFLNRHDLREVLDMAQAAARAAYGDEAERVTTRHVRAVFEIARG